MISGIVLLSSLLFSANPALPAPWSEAAAGSAPADAVAAETATLIAKLRRPAPADTAYLEVRFVHVLQRPLVLRGELHYGGPAQLGKRVDTPYRETTTIADGQVSVEREGKPAKHFSLERAPELQALLGSFSALLGGDALALNGYYSIAAENAGPNWRLTLTPRAPALARQLRQMTVDGRTNEPRCFTLNEADGDASVMLLGELAATKLASPPVLADIVKLCRGNTP
jgi:hypothetical protein